MAVSGAHVKQLNRYANGENIAMLLLQQYSFRVNSRVNYYTAIAFYAQPQILALAMKSSDVFFVI